MIKYLMSNNTKQRIQINSVLNIQAEGEFYYIYSTAESGAKLRSTVFSKKQIKRIQNNDAGYILVCKRFTLVQD